jgi:hypothetical protein
MPVMRTKFESNSGAVKVTGPMGPAPEQVLKVDSKKA